MFSTRILKGKQKIITDMAAQRTYDKTKLTDSYSEKKKNEKYDKNHEKATMGYKMM